MTPEERALALAAARIREAEAWNAYWETREDYEAARREHDSATAARITLERQQ